MLVNKIVCLQTIENAIFIRIIPVLAIETKPQTKSNNKINNWKDKKIISMNSQGITDKIIFLLLYLLRI